MWRACEEVPEHRRLSLDTLAMPVCPASGTITQGYDSRKLLIREIIDHDNIPPRISAVWSFGPCGRANVGNQVRHKLQKLAVNGNLLGLPRRADAYRVAPEVFLSCRFDDCFKFPCAQIVVYVFQPCQA